MAGLISGSDKKQIALIGFCQVYIVYTNLPNHLFLHRWIYSDTELCLRGGEGWNCVQITVYGMEISSRKELWINTLWFQKFSWGKGGWIAVRSEICQADRFFGNEKKFGAASSLVGYQTWTLTKREKLPILTKREKLRGYWHWAKEKEFRQTDVGDVWGINTNTKS